MQNDHSLNENCSSCENKVSSTVQMAGGRMAYILTLIVTLGIIGTILGLTYNIGEIIENPIQSVIYLAVGIGLIAFSYSQAKKLEFYDKSVKYRRMSGALILLIGNSFIALATVGIFGRLFGNIF